MAGRSPKPGKNLRTLFARCAETLRDATDRPHKRVGAHRYYHLTSCNCARLAARAAERLNSEYTAGAAANDIVAKLHDTEGISLLVYERFAAGLLAEPHTVGFRNQWNRRLDAMGYSIDGFQLKKLR